MGAAEQLCHCPDRPGRVVRAGAGWHLLVQGLREAAQSPEALAVTEPEAQGSPRQDAAAAPAQGKL